GIREPLAVVGKKTLARGGGYCVVIAGIVWRAAATTAEFLVGFLRTPYFLGGRSFSGDCASVVHAGFQALFFSMGKHFIRCRTFCAVGTMGQRRATGNRVFRP